MKRECRSALQRALNDLFQRRSDGIKPGLAASRRLLHHLGNPHLDYPTIHVAGTNGKGSVCAILESVLRSAGFCTGLYTSPHLVDFNERFQVNAKPVSNAQLEHLSKKILEASDAVSKEPEGRSATFFECSTAIAFQHFKDRKVDVAIIETGMGGRLDATNVVLPILSVITSVGRDHTAFLGHTPTEIAGEKAGIIKKQVPVVMGEMSEEAGKTIMETASRQDSLLLCAKDLATIRRVAHGWDGQRIHVGMISSEIGLIHLPLLGRHQLSNALTALGAIEALRAICGRVIEDKAIRSGLSDVCWPGRGQRVESNPPLMVDCAHNPAGMETLVQTLTELAPGKKWGMVLGFLDDKDYHSMLRIVSSIAGPCWVTEIKDDRAVSRSALLETAQGLGLDAREASLPNALDAARRWAGKCDGQVCVTGSVHLAGEVLAKYSSA